MAATRTTAVVGVLAFLAGAGVAALVAATFVTEPAAETAPAADAPVSQRPGRADAERPPATPRAERPRMDGAAPSAAPERPVRSVAPGITDDEAAFLVKALAAERIRRTESVVREGDEGLGIMQRYLQHGADVEPLVADFDAMRAHVRVPAAAPRRFDATGERTDVDLGKEAGDATVLEFGPGTFVLTRGQSSWNVRKQDVDALEIRGAGMDKTKLIGPGWAFLCMTEGASLRNLVIKDLTIDGSEQGQIILDARGGISAALERVRLAGWQVAGHASALGVSGSAFLACRECDFAGPGDGFVLSLRGDGLATFDRCRFADAAAAFIGPGGADRAAVVALRDCTFENSRLADSRIRGSTKHGGVKLLVRGATVGVPGASSWTDEKRLEWWGASYAALTERVTFTSAKTAFPFTELLRAADLAAVAGIADIVSIDVQPGARGAPPEIDFYVFDRTKEVVVRRTRRLTATALDPVEQEPRRGMRGRSVKSAAEIDGVLPIAELLRRAGIPDDECVTQVELRPLPKPQDGSQVTMLMATAPGGRQSYLVDARTGVAQPRR